MLSVGIGLGICAAWDWKRREIPVWLLLAFQAIALGAAIFCSEETLESRAAAFGLGMLFFLFSKITDQAIGYADSWIILSLGIYLGIKKLLLVLFVASFTAAIVSLVILWIRKWNRKDTIPFIPFLILGYTGMILL